MVIDAFAQGGELCFVTQSLKAALGSSFLRPPLVFRYHDLLLKWLAIWAQYGLIETTVVVRPFFGQVPPMSPNVTA